MEIYDQVSRDLKVAMRARDKARTTAIRAIRAAFIEEIKRDNAERIGDEAAIAILRRLAKQRSDSIDAYSSGGRDDLVETERAELEIIDAYLPSLADEATTRAWVVQAIATSGASEPRDLGRVMGALMRAHRGAIDGRLANEIARELLVAG